MVTSSTSSSEILGWINLAVNPKSVRRTFFQSIGRNSADEVPWLRSRRADCMALELSRKGHALAERDIIHALNTRHMQVV